MTTPPVPGIYSAFAATSALLIGPHNRFTRNGIVFNDTTQLECFWVTDPTGFDSPDAQPTDQPNAEETGTLPDPAFHGARTMTLTGYIQAGSYPTMLNMGAALLASLVDLIETPMEISVADASYFTQESVFINCRAADRPQITMAIQPTDVSGVIKRAFTVALKATDPTYTAAVENHAVIIPQVISIPGRPYDRFYDLDYTTLMDETGTLIDAGTVNFVMAQNDGNWDASARIRLSGPMTNITLVNQTTGQVMYFSSIAIDEWIEIDTHPTLGYVKDQNGNDADGQLGMRSDYIVIHGVRGGYDGSNKLVLYVESYDLGGQVDVYWKDTWL